MLGTYWGRKDTILALESLKSANRYYISPRELGGAGLTGGTLWGGERSNREVKDQQADKKNMVKVTSPRSLTQH